VNTVTASFNANMGQMTEMYQRKKGKSFSACTCTAFNVSCSYHIPPVLSLHIKTLRCNSRFATTIRSLIITLHHKLFSEIMTRLEQHASRKAERRVWCSCRRKVILATYTSSG